MTSQNYQLIRQAILAKQCVEADHTNKANNITTRRQMCPHTLGISKEGEEQALFYQYAGDSSKGLGPAGSPKNWRCLKVSDLRGLQVISGTWQGAPNHSRQQTCVDQIDVEISY